MKINTIAIAVIIFSTCLIACNTSSNNAKYQTMLDNQWQNRKSVIIDSMNYNCQQMIANKMNQDVNRILEERGLK